MAQHRMSWAREFDEPIETPDGKQLRTLREAVAYIAKTVPKSELSMPAVATAAKMPTYAAERELAWMVFARIATSKAIHRSRGPGVQPDAKEHHWGKRKLKRDE